MTTKGYLYMLLFFAVIVVLFSIIYSSAVNTIDITVADKERVNTTDESKYLIFTKDEVFENTDTIVFMKFNSSDLYRDLERGHTYNVKVAGWRINFLSMYRNIIKINKEYKK